VFLTIKKSIAKFLFSTFVLAVLSANCLAVQGTTVPILVYHNFDKTASGSMTISVAKFEEQMRWLYENGYTVIPLQTLVDYLQGEIASLPEKAVVITADDGRKSVYTYMWPIVNKYNFPVTLFVYPSAISNAPYAMTWQQLRELQDTGLFDVQGHTYWHPNFKQEKKRLSAAAFQQLVDAQLTGAKKIIDQKMDKKITLLAWPFGIYDDYLEKEAEKAGYTMTFSIDARHASSKEGDLTQPRYMIVEPCSDKTFAEIVKGMRYKH